MSTNRPILFQLIGRIIEGVNLLSLDGRSANPRSGIMNPEEINEIIGKLQAQQDKLRNLVPPPDGYKYIDKNLEWSIFYLKCVNHYADTEGGG